MAASVYQASGSRIPQQTSNIGDQRLPSGACNFRDLNTGATAPACGCKTFWLNHGSYNGQRAWCFCGHHACFHDAISQQQQHVLGQALSVEVRNGEVEAQYGYSASAQREGEVINPEAESMGLGIRPSSTQGQSINTRLFSALNAFAREQEDVNPSNTTSKLPSTACPSVAGEIRPSPARMLQQQAQLSRSMGPPINILSGYMTIPTAEEYSATEVATPSLSGTPDLRGFAAPALQARTSVSSAALGASATVPLAIDIRRTIESVQPLPAPTSTTIAALPPHEVTTLLRAFGRRIDILESLSFSQVPVEEIQEKFEFFDGRLLDLEQWRTDQENACLNVEPIKAESSKHRRLLPTETSSLASDGSFDSVAAVHTEAAVLATLAANAETGPRIDALENRIADLEDAALPSFARPWQIQVVVLPWGPELRGIWFSALDATQRPSQVESDEWAVPSSRLSFDSSATNAWTTESIEAWADDAQHWLSPKACGPAGVVFRRLASRGFIQDVTWTASDSRHIMSTLHAAFAKYACTAGNDGSDQEDQYQALREEFVPLRKVRKSSRLRLLSPAEMVTSATWTAAFLDSSVIMKVNDGQRRLYVTTPEAYLQPAGPSWAWAILRQLPIFNATGDEQAAQATNAAIEACWTYNDRLDRPISTQASFASQGSQWNVQSEQSMHDGLESGEDLMSPQPDPRSKRQRTVSLPSSSSAVEQAQAFVPQRRVASFENGTTTRLSDGQIALLATSKRRRVTISPEAERRGVGLTPRWSREPPSPFSSEHVGEGLASRKRGTTPFAYATPHSNSNHVGRVEAFAGDGDTEPDTDIVAAHSESGEEEWHGVEDEEMGSDVHQVDEQSAIDEAEIDENDLDLGLTIYEG